MASKRGKYQRGYVMWDDQCPSECPKCQGKRMIGTIDAMVHLERLRGQWLVDAVDPHGSGGYWTCLRCGNEWDTDG